MKTLRRFSAKAIAIVLAVALALCALTFTATGSMFAFAATTAATLVENVTIKDKVAYGGDIVVPAAASGASVTVKAPNGKTVGTSAGTYKAHQIGRYSVTYNQGDASYTFYVQSSLDEDYILKVDNNGAGIPTYMANGGSFDLPKASVVYYDDDNIMHTYPGTAEITVEDSLGNKYDVTGETPATFTATQTGRVYFYYTARLKTEADSGEKYYSQTFTVNVQSTFTDTKNPTLTVTGVPTTASVNRIVTLPIASATDDYDENIKIDVTVTDPNGDEVLNVDLNEYGYAYREEGKTYEKVRFDNENVLSFYPLVEGSYTVTYKATDDVSTHTITRSFPITCSDKAAPVFHDIDESSIPTTWGVTSIIGANNQTVAGKAGKITFPMPVVVDNKDRVNTDADTKNDVTVSFRITDSDNSRTVIEFSNIYADGDADGGKVTGNSTYGDDNTTYEFNKANPSFTFDLSQYHRVGSDNASTNDLTGSYTVTYRAKDVNGNSSSKTYTITMEDSFTDANAPTTAEVETPSYISVTEEDLVIPTPVVQDYNNVDSRLKVDYRIYTDAAGATPAFITVKGGEEAEISFENSKYYLVVDDQKLELATKLYYFVSATDDVGNVKYNTTDGSNDYTKSESIVTVADSSTASNYTYTPDGGIADGSYTANSDANLGGFTLTGISESMRSFTGFEIRLTDAEGGVLATTAETFSQRIASGDASTYTLHVKNITTKVGAQGDYVLAIRTFDVSGKSSVYTYKFTVAAGDDDDNIASAAIALPSTGGALDVRYTLPNSTIRVTGSTGTYYVVRKISGVNFSLMGSEFIAKEAGTYYFADGTINESDIAGYDYSKVTPYGKGYSLRASASSTIALEVQGTMPSYKEKNQLVELPSVIAISNDGNAKVEAVVKNPSSTIIESTYNEEENFYSFTPTVDGAYTVTYTATLGNADPVIQTFTINVGDVIAPNFTVTAPSTRMTVGNYFKFSKIVVTDEADAASSAGTTITKKIYDPSGNEITAGTITGSYTTYKDYIVVGGPDSDDGDGVELTMSGTYTVEYTVTDRVGNPSVQKYTISVSQRSTTQATTLTTVSTVLIVVAVLLLAGVIIYVVRFRKHKN